MKKTLREFMTSAPQHAMSYVNSNGELVKLPTLHSTCMELTGVSRPGKTARDRAKLARRQP